MFSPILVALATSATIILTSDEAVMDSDATPDKGPEMATVYVPGEPGGDWTSEEVESTRKRILKILTPVWTEKEEMGLSGSSGRNQDNIPGEVSENVILRLVFHDCIPYTDGTGGCDGCLNWNHMDSEIPNPNDVNHWYVFNPPNATDNRGLDGAAIALELIYTTLDWPFQNPSLDVSLRQSGKSRADLWQFAGLVALELGLERANRACDLDYHARQQVTLLESREKCEIKLTSPLKFQTGRSDCIADDPERGYVTYKDEEQPKLMSSGHELIDYGRNFFSMDAEHFAALMGIHGAVHKAAIGLKYTWMGAGYISNMFFKQLANKPMYFMGKGGDLSFTSCGEPLPIYNVAIGDADGNPQAYTGWRTSCMYLWNATHGGPCVLRPTHFNSNDSPFTGNFLKKGCVEGINEEDGSCVIASSRRCGSVYCDEKGVLHGSGRGDVESRLSSSTGAYSEDLPMNERGNRHNNAFSNQFAFPWEVGMMYNFTVGGDSQIPMGCEGLDDDFGSLPNANWIYRNMNSPIWATSAMKCNLNDYAPEGKPMHEIIEDLASDNEYFAEKFLESYGMMISNGYSKLNDGPQNGWLGYYSLSQQGIDVGDFTSYIAANSPVTFTDKNTDPWICGHRGHSTISCGVRFSKYFEIGMGKYHQGDGCDLMV